MPAGPTSLWPSRCDSSIIALSLGVRSVQVGLGTRDSAYTNALRAKIEAASAHLEGIAALPRDQADLDRFEAEIRTAKNAGVSIVRTVTMSGRRYETFDSERELPEIRRPGVSIP